MDITIIIFGTVMLALVQVQIFKALPGWLRGFLAFIPLLGIMANFGFSQFLLHFIGLAYGLGLCNMISSVFFGIWLYDYKRKLIVKKRFMGFPIFQDKKRSYDDYANENFN